MPPVTSKRLRPLKTSTGAMSSLRLLSESVHAKLDLLAGGTGAFGLAVSGGGDSIALMHLVKDWSRGRRIMVATVDHRLRPESAAEARQVALWAAELDLPHETLIWHDPTMPGNIMANARNARLDLLADWARRNDLPAIALGHTADDLAETLLMRLNRGAGIDGLSAMAGRRHSHGIDWLRPLLNTRRSELRDWLREHEISWLDDPSNDNPDYHRIRIRQAISATGLSVESLAQSAQNLTEAREALSHYALQIAKTASIQNASLTFPLQGFAEAPSEIRRRLLIAACRWITGADYAPRRKTVQHALEGIQDDKRVTLDGALIVPSRGALRIQREPAAAILAASGQTVWDNRWQISGLQQGQHVAALGNRAQPGLNRRESGLSHDEAAASPAIWAGTTLVAAPLLDGDRRFTMIPIRNADDFLRLVMVH